jgi:hypothetical protein
VMYNRGMFDPGGVASNDSPTPPSATSHLPQGAKSYGDRRSLSTEMPAIHMSFQFVERTSCVGFPAGPLIHVGTISRGVDVSLLSDQARVLKKTFGGLSQL